MSIFQKIKCFFTKCEKQKQPKIIDKVKEDFPEPTNKEVKKERHWYNNGTSQKILTVQEAEELGWDRGRLKKKDN